VCVCVCVCVCVEGVPLATEPCISLIILTPMMVLQRNLNRTRSFCEKWRRMCRYVILRNSFWFKRIIYFKKTKIPYKKQTTKCPTRYRTRHFFNNFNTNEDIATKLEQDSVVVWEMKRNVSAVRLVVATRSSGPPASQPISCLIHLSTDLSVIWLRVPTQ
jgi:hypothetical protein